MPVKRKAKRPGRKRPVGRPRKRRVKRGAGFWDALKSANNWLRSNKAISNVAGALASVGVPYASQVQSVASKLGYGRRRVRRRRQGAGFFDVVKSANNWLRSNKAISNVAGALAKSNVPYAAKVAEVAGKLGYGRRRPVRRTAVRYRGSGFTTEQIAAPRFS
jgi:hypothetical protein